MTPSSIIKINTSTGTSAQVLSLAKKSLLGLIFVAMRKTVAKTSVILSTLLPITLAMAISGLLLRLAEILAAISGKEVPRAISVAPMINSGMLNQYAHGDNKNNKIQN
jgi:hypothetical protein